MMYKWRMVYETLFTRYLLATNTVISCGLMSLADYCVQKLERAQHNDWSRTGRMGIIGFIFGPPEHYWYKYLDRRFPGTKAITVSKKVIMDEAINGPFSIVVFFVGMNKLSGKSWLESMEDMKSKFWPVYKIELLIWPAAQAINFYIIPPPFRMLYVDVVYLIWEMFLSYYQHKKKVTN